MKRNELIAAIQDVGLTESEAKLYVTALTQGPSTALSLSRATEIKRATVYGQIESLKKKGMMRIEFNGAKKRFVAENPTQLKQVIDQRKTKLDKVIPALASLYNLGGKESFIKYYEGINGLKALYEELLRIVHPREDFCVIAHQHEWYERDAVYFEHFLERRAKIVHSARLIFQDSERARFSQERGNLLRQEVRLLPNGVTMNADIIVTPHCLVVHQWKDPITALMIENHNVAQTQLEIFNFMWNVLPAREEY